MNAAKVVSFLHLVKINPCFYLELDPPIQTNKEFYREKENQIVHN